MIIVTRLHGASVAVNCDLIERAEATPDTVLTLVDGSRYVVRESVGRDRRQGPRLPGLGGPAGRPPGRAGHHLYLVPSPDPDA